MNAQIHTRGGRPDETPCTDDVDERVADRLDRCPWTTVKEQVSMSARGDFEMHQGSLYNICKATGGEIGIGTYQGHRDKVTTVRYLSPMDKLQFVSEKGRSRTGVPEFADIIDNDRVQVVLVPFERAMDLNGWDGDVAIGGGHSG